jgi:hypothetical protein
MRGIDRQLARERAAEHLVGSDQRPQPFVDLPVLAFAAALHRLHHEQADADHDEGDDAQPQQRGRQRLPGTEIDGASHRVRGSGG